MPLGPSSLAHTTGSAAQNTQFQAAAENVPRKILLIGTPDPAKLDLTPDEPFLVLSAADAGDQVGFGFQLHRLAIQAFKGGQGTPVYLVPQDEAGGAVVSAGEIDFTGSVGIVAGTLAIYIGAERVPVSVATAMIIEDLSSAVVTAINANQDLPVIATQTPVTFEVVLTAKSKGPGGDLIDISLNLGAGEKTPAGITTVITAMTGGAGLPDIQTALDGLGVDDDANEDFFTEMAHGYGQDTTTLDAVANYVGQGNDFLGTFKKTVARPFRSFVADVATGSAGLNALIAVTDLRLEDRVNGTIGAPGSLSHPNDIGAQAVGHIARVSDQDPAKAYNETTLIDIHPGAKADRWTANFDSRDTAVKSGISPTKVEGGALKLQNMISMYRPANVAVSSNGWRESANFAKVQNLLNSQKVLFSSAKWTNFSVVIDTNEVADPIAKLSARDRTSVLGDVVTLVKAWAAKAWIADAAFTISELQSKPELITIRGTGDGFNVQIPVVLSGVGNIMDVTTFFDISFAVLITS